MKETAVQVNERKIRNGIRKQREKIWKEKQKVWDKLKEEPNDDAGWEEWTGRTIHGLNVEEELVAILKEEILKERHKDD